MTPPCAVAAPPRVLRTVEEALDHVQAICFKTGPPQRVGVELEWVLHHRDDPTRPLDTTTIRAALAEHTPPTLDPSSPHQPLLHGGVVSVEPGGQLEVSTPPYDSLAELYRTTSAELDYLAERLASAGLRLEGHGLDPYRPPTRLVRTARYDAMAGAFARRSSAGLIMMCGTAATQVCFDAGEAGEVRERWQTLHALGPVLLALFATSGRHAGRDTGWASARMQAWLATDPARTAPVPEAPDPAAAWARYALAAPLLCLRRRSGGWHAPAGVTFADWIAGAIEPAPTVDDLEYHLGTLFPPVRPRGYLEARYLDAQPPQEWFAPVALLAALLADPVIGRLARERAAPVARAWVSAARHGLADPALRAAAAGVAQLAEQALARTDLPEAVCGQVTRVISRRLAGREE